MTVVLSLLFSVIFRCCKKRNYDQSIEQMTIGSSNSRSEDQILRHVDEENGSTLEHGISRIRNHKKLNDGVHFYDPALLHPLVRKLCCCPGPNDYDEKDDVTTAEMR